ncbi:hypothetical protein ANCDUO_08230 [Ancylostoma duodenale]|uniref:Fungal lipase-type domain-containing protein n=1 Tax=Ancylostoma duodenale TaxID=51022 RepID=A0A0C2GQW9_9BILA|nr:hypothetical protein ANCDUO_08230 [Ancylostoma duodenale]
MPLKSRADLKDPHTDDSWDKFYFPLKMWLYGGNVSSFLANGFKELWENKRMRDEFQKTIASGIDKVLITGHYVGGALATLVAHDIVADNRAENKDVTVITLGQMMVGDEEFAKAYEEQVQLSAGTRVDAIFTPI